MSSLIFLLAWRYIINSTHEKNISTMVKICFIGIFLGSFSLALITAVMNGYEKEIHKKMQGIHAHALIRSGSQGLNVDAIKKVIGQEFPQIAQVSPTTSGYVLIPSTTDGDIPGVVMLRAIDPAAETNVSTLAQKIVAPTELADPLTQALANNRLLIGKKFAKEFGLSPNDNAQLMYPDNNSETPDNRISLLRTTALVGGIFHTGIEEFDAGVIFCTFEFFNSLFPDTGVTQLNIKLHDGVTDYHVLPQLKQRLGLDVCSWKELYPALVSALMLEKYVMFIIILLITLVASMNILSLLFMEITSKRADIAILRVMGANPNTISAVFALIGLSIAATAALAGIAAAYLASALFAAYPFITLPDVYYVSHLPVLMEWRIGLVVFCAVIFISLIASWLPTRRISTLNIAQILRSEG